MSRYTEKTPRVYAPLLKLNYGCGETNLEGFVNIDSVKNERVNPDVIADITKGSLPFESEGCELIHCLHNLEHIEQKYWPFVFSEFRRILIPEGELRLAYPEFEICAKYFIENYRGMRTFWRRTLYGRQLYPGDFHVVPMRTVEVVNLLEEAGFHGIKTCPEPEQSYNTFLIAFKTEMPMTKEDILRREIFKK